MWAMFLNQSRDPCGASVIKEIKHHLKDANSAAETTVRAAP